MAARSPSSRSNSSRKSASPLPTDKPFRVPVPLKRSKPTPAAGKRSKIAAALGEQIRALRMAAGLSSTALAASSGLSRSMLSRVERGLASPSIEALERISTALDVPLSRFFVDQVRRTDCSFVPAGEGLKVSREGVIKGYDYELIGHLLSGNLFVEPYVVELSKQAEPYTTFQHPGLKLIYFLSGRVRYRYGARTMEAGKGDTLLFDATALHGAEAILQRPVRYLSIVFTMRD